MKRARVLVLVVAAACTAVQPKIEQSRPAVAARMERVESGLLPAVIVDGRREGSDGMHIADRMRHYHIPGVSVAVINDNKVEWAKGYGTTEMGGTVPVTAKTIFEAGSISKPVTAAAALALAAAGRLNLDEDVNAKLTSWRVPDSPFTRDKRVTLRQLASHSAGFLRRQTEDYAPGEAIPTAAQVLDGAKPSKAPAILIERTPGTSFTYSNGGYTVIQILLGDVTGQAFPALMRDLVFDKVGMPDSFFEQPLPPLRQAQAALGYDDDGKMVGDSRHVVAPDMAAGGLRATAVDLARFALAIMDAHSGRSTQLMSQATARLMLTPQVDFPIVWQDPGATWGFGLELFGSGRAARFGHGGSRDGFECQFWAYPETGQGVVVMTNGGQGRRLAGEIIRSVSRVYDWPDLKPTVRRSVPVSPDILAAYVGRYGKDKIDVTLEHDCLFVKPPGYFKDQLVPSAATEFFITTEPATTFKFTRDARGAVDGVFLHLNDGSTLNLPKSR